MRRTTITYPQFGALVFGVIALGAVVGWVLPSDVLTGALTVAIALSLGLEVWKWMRGRIRARIHVLHVKEGDIVTLTMDGVMTPQQAQMVKEHWERRCPETRVVVMSEGLHPSAVIRPEPPTPRRISQEQADSYRRTTRPERPPSRPSTTEGA